MIKLNKMIDNFSKSEFVRIRLPIVSVKIKVVIISSENF